MVMRLNRESFEKLISEDLEWLMNQPRTLEREHVIQIVRDCVDMYYPRPFHAEFEKPQ